MKCISCGANTNPGLTTDVTELENCLIVIRNVPCHKCSECSEIMYTGDVVRKLEHLLNAAKQMINEITIIDYQKGAA